MSGHDDLIPRFDLDEKRGEVQGVRGIRHGKVMRHSLVSAKGGFKTLERHPLCLRVRLFHGVNHGINLFGGIGVAAAAPVNLEVH